MTDTWKNRSWLYLSIAAVLVLAAGESAISARDPEGVWTRVGMILIVVGAAMWLPWPALIPAVLVIWLVPNALRGTLSDNGLPPFETVLDLVGLVGLGLAAALVQHHLRYLEEENAILGTKIENLSEMDPETGVYLERRLGEAIEEELIRSRRFGRQFAFVLAGVSELKQRFEYRDEEQWRTGFKAAAHVLLHTRIRVDRVYRHGDRGFALLLPESGAGEVTGLVRRLNRLSRRASPPEGEPGGPLPMHFGATFFPQCATTVDDLMRRAEVALRLAEKSPNRVMLDRAEAPDLPAPESLRRTSPQPQPQAVGGGDAAMEREGLAVAAAFASAKASGEPLPVGQAVSELLDHLNETLDLIKTMRSGSAA